MRLLLGDCVKRMAEMDEASVDAIVTDPPYELTAGKKGGSGAASLNVNSPAGRARIGTGFMGKTWDGTGVAFDPKTWAEVLRVLKPGGHLLAFGGTRTSHRMVCAIEDAGFEIRDSVIWMYGCLTADTEILSVTGWKWGVDVTEGEQVAAWDPTDESIHLAPVERKYLAPWSGPMRAFVNSDTDQLVTPNHSVWHKTVQRHQEDGVRSARYEDAWTARDADLVTRNQPTRLPLSGFHNGTGIGGNDYASLLGWVWTEGGFDKTGTGVRIYQSSSANPGKVKDIDELLGRLGFEFKRYERERTYRYKTTERQYTEVCWFFSGEWANRVRADIPGKHPTYALLWRMSQDEKMAFYDAAMAGDGSHMAFYQSDHDDLVWFQALLANIGRRGRINPHKQCVAVAVSGRTEMQHRHFKASPDQQYDGLVWCVGVSTGAFVARRNGQVFITGNSGFPKSMNVSKAIDKAAGAQRQVVGTKLGQPGYSLAPSNEDHRTYSRGLGNTSDPARECEITAPATLEAEQWDGWGTALKPAHEPIVVARKPLIGTVAANVLKYGTGALNIDGCRIGGEGGARRGPSDIVHSSPNAVLGAGLDLANAAPKVPGLGRWPANVILDEEAGAMLDEQTGVTSSGSFPRRRGADTDTRVSFGAFAGGDTVGGPRKTDSGGASRFFYCSKTSASERSAGLPGKNPHPTVKPIALMRYLVRLVTPPSGTVLDPFLGSGSTGIAAIQEGFNFIGIEKEAPYFLIARQRIKYASEAA